MGYSCPLNTTNATAFPCAPGTFSKGGAAECSPCSTANAEFGGFFCPGATDAIPCAPGSYAPRGSSLSECRLCESGTWADKPGPSCDVCPAGKYGIKRGGVSEADACAVCEENTFSSGGTSACTPCAKGFGGPPNSPIRCTSECLPNEVTTGVDQGGDRPYCKTCDVGRGEAPNSKQDACETGTIICPAGQMLSFGRRRCDPLVCPSPLRAGTEFTALKIDKTVGAKCIGCPNGTVGRFPECAPCSGDLCIGPASRKLANFSHASAYNVTDCPPLKGLGASNPPDVPPPLNVARPCKDERIRLTGTCAYDAAIVALITLCSLFATLPLFARLSRMQWLNTILCAADMFAMSGNVPDNGWPIKRPTAVGGTCTCAGIFTLATATAVLIALQRDPSNVAVSRSVDVYSEKEESLFTSLPFRNTTDPWSTGLQVRITASCEPGSLVLNAAPVGSDVVTPPLVNVSGGNWTAGSWAYEGNSVGAWALDNVTLADGAPRVCGVDNTTTQLIFRCAKCTLTTSSTLSIALPFSCQSLLIEAAALDAFNSLAVLRANSTLTRGSSSGRLLTKLEWRVKLLASVIEHNVTKEESTRGYTFAGSELKVTSNPLLPIAGLPANNRSGNATGNATALSPSAEAVVVIVAFPLEPYFVNTVVKERVDLPTLLTNIVGLAGIFAVFGIGRELLHTLFPANERNAVAARPAELAELRDSIRAELLADLRAQGVLPALDGAAHDALPAPDGAAHDALPAPDGAARGARPAPDGAPRGTAAIAAGAFAAAQKHSTLSNFFLDSARAAARQLHWQPPQEAPADGAFMFQNPLHPEHTQRRPEEVPL